MHPASPSICPALLLALLTAGSVAFPGETDPQAFEVQLQREWTPVFADEGSRNWKSQWFLDGDQARVTNSREGMTLDTTDGYAVLWTRSEFEGDLRIEYDFRRMDRNDRGVNILYIQATGDGEDGHEEDIALWSDRRRTAAMKDYFQNMHTYHVSYAAFGTKESTAHPDYVRGRRYLPLTNEGLKGTALTPEYTDTGLFNDSEWIHVTVIKRDKELWIRFEHPDRTLLCHFINEDKPAITKGRVGLRLMPGRTSQFRHFTVQEVRDPSS